MPDLQRPDGDTSIIFLVGNGVVFSEQTRDDWYRVSTFYSTGTTTAVHDKSRFPFYQADEAASPLGCVSQYQYCIVGTSGERQCGPLSSAEDVVPNAALAFGIIDEDLTPGRVSSSSKKGSQFSWAAEILHHSTGIGIDEIIAHLGPRSLDSQTGLSMGVQGYLPVDQWKRDVTRWYNASKAAAQAAFTGVARGISDPGFDECAGCVSPAINTYEERMCQNQVRSSCFGYSGCMLTRVQKVLSTAYASFSLFGLCFTFATGFVIALLSYLVEPVLEYLHKHSKQFDEYKYLEWTSHSVLQLQRQGHENLGLGTWEKCIDKVPICRPEEIMGTLDITDGSHPLLRRPSFDSELPGVKPEKTAQNSEAVERVVDSTGDQDGGKGQGEQRTDQTSAHEDTSHGESDTSSLGNTTMTPSLQLNESSALRAKRVGEEAPSPENNIPASSVHMEGGSPPTAERVQERKSE